MTIHRFDMCELKQLFKNNKVATLFDLKKTLKTDARITVFRKLRKVSAITSYSHGGAYYTLPSIPRFDRHGLWCFESARFSQYGTLKNTLREWIARSKAGYFEKELEQRLQVVVRVPLANLLKEKMIDREKLSAHFLYLSPDPTVRRQQIATRQKEEAFGKPAEPAVLHHELKAALVLFFSLLDERQKRVYAALESLKRGRGSDRIVAELLGINRETVARGRQELLSGQVEKNRICKAGGGRKPLEKKDQTSPKSSRT